MVGQIIVVGGTSGSGKSTTADAWVRRREDFWLRYGVDAVLSSTFPSRFHMGVDENDGIRMRPMDPANPGGQLRWDFGRYGMAPFETLHEWAASASRLGYNIVFDELMMTDPPVLQDCIWRLEGLPVLFVQLKPPFEILHERLVERGRASIEASPDLMIGNRTIVEISDMLDRMREWYYAACYANDLCDLEIDTTVHDVDAVCDLIAKRLAKGPGTAFNALRERYQRPTRVAVSQQIIA